MFNICLDDLQIGNEEIGGKFRQAFEVDTLVSPNWVGAAMLPVARAHQKTLDRDTNSEGQQWQFPTSAAEGVSSRASVPSIKHLASFEDI